MSETAKLRGFTSEPMGNKLIGEVPGVGPIAARKFKTMYYTKARDLYNRLKKLDFDEKKFRVWVTINCKGAKVATIYKALVGYHNQIGDEESDDLEIPSSETPQVRSPLAARVGRATFSARRPRSRNSVQFDLPASERENSTPDDDTPRSNNHYNDANPLTLFFASFSDSCKNISPEFHTDLKMDILRIVGQYERKTREKKNAPTPSTSSVSNGA